MEYDEILNEAMRLPAQQRHQLAYALRRDTDKVAVREARKDECRRQLWVYLKVMAKILGSEPNRILTKDRLTDHVHARWVIWARLYDEGFSQNMIAELSGFGHNIVQVAVERVGEIKDHPRYDSFLADLYKRFNEAIK